MVFRFAQAVGILPLTGTSNAEHMKQDLASRDLALSSDASDRIAGGLMARCANLRLRADLRSGRGRTERAESASRDLALSSEEVRTVESLAG